MENTNIENNSQTNNQQSPSNDALDPIPDQINSDTGKSMWIIRGYKIWAYNYKQALELLPMIEGF